MTKDLVKVIQSGCILDDGRIDFTLVEEIVDNLINSINAFANEQHIFCGSNDNPGITNRSIVRFMVEPILIKTNQEGNEILKEYLLYNFVNLRDKSNPFAFARYKEARVSQLSSLKLLLKQTEEQGEVLFVSYPYKQVKDNNLDKVIETPDYSNIKAATILTKDEIDEILSQLDIAAIDENGNHNAQLAFVLKRLRNMEVLTQKKHARKICQQEQNEIESKFAEELSNVEKFKSSCFKEGKVAVKLNRDTKPTLIYKILKSGKLNPEFNEKVELACKQNFIEYRNYKSEVDKIWESFNLAYPKE